MIQPNELRRNNLIMYGNMMYPVDRITESTISVRLSSNSLRTGRPHEFEPIPLSPEILEACGTTHSHHRFNAFESEERYALYIAEDEEYAVCFVTATYGGEENKYIRFRKLPDDILWLHDFKYLHTLQNAIYMYTGSELSVNLEKVVS